MQLWPIPPEAALLAALAVAVLLGLELRRRRRRPGADAVNGIAPPASAVEKKPEADPPAAQPSAALRLRAALSKSRDALRQRLADVFGRNREIDALLASLEEALLGADVGVRTTARILGVVRTRCAGDREPAPAKVRAALRDAIEAALGDGVLRARRAKPWVILVCGVNGVGKTTSIGKLAARFRAAGDKVLLVAADTFRAAAIEQLGIWAERVGADLVRHQSGADPAAVAFDGMKAAVAREADVVLVDTAGRLHTRENLMQELRKVSRVIGKAIPGAPHEAWLVLDATTGQNALSQAKVFTEALGLSGIVLTKLDGTAKGGAALAIREELGVPILYVGVGEGLDDLRPFSSAEYARALLGEE
ncbi:MAG: signal recognition particle-docking protein FtsY [Deltaproteobacteria bacterium]|nr:signal recognition particle-docking protein FtsY [Deltaproteobacteria bacterium]